MQSIRFTMLREGEPSMALVCPAVIEHEFRFLQEEAQEHLFVVILDCRNRAIGRHLVAKGTQTACMVSVRDIARAVLLAGGVRCLLVHNHPSGASEPSEGDLELTRTIAKGLELLELELLDHLILGDECFSFAEAGLLK